MRRDPVLGAAIKRIGPCGMADRQRKDHLSARWSARSSASSCRPRRRRRSSAGSSRCFPTATFRERGGDRRAERRGAARRRPERAEGQLPARSRRAHRRRPAAARRARDAAGRRGDRAADGGEGLRPLDRRDVPDVPAASARRAAGGRPRDRQRDSAAVRLRKRPDAKRVLKIGEAWRPYRSVASWYLWQTLRNEPLSKAADSPRRSPERPALAEQRLAPRERRLTAETAESQRILSLCDLCVLRGSSDGIQRGTRAA